MKGLILLLICVSASLSNVLHKVGKNKNVEIDVYYVKDIKT